MGRRLLPIVFFLLLPLAPVQAADSRFVTDTILVELRERPSAQSNVAGVAPTGTPVKVLEGYGIYSKVTLPDGRQGWVESRLLSEREPAQVTLLRVMDEYERLNAANQRLEAQVERSRPGTFMVWSAIGLSVGLFCGFILGTFWLEHRFRTRHGGMRI